MKRFWDCTRGTDPRNESAHYREPEATNNTCESLKQQQREAREATAELEGSNKAPLLETELSETREALKGHTVESSDVLSRCEESLPLTKAELEQARSDAVTASTLASETISKQDANIDSLRSNLDEVRKALSNEKCSNRVLLQAKEECIVSSRSQLAQVQLLSEVSEKDVTIELLRTELEDLW